MNANAPKDASDGPKAANGAAPAAPAGAALPTGTSAPQAGDLDLEVEEIKLPERLKEGFVGQER